MKRNTIWKHSENNKNQLIHISWRCNGDSQASRRHDSLSNNIVCKCRFLNKLFFFLLLFYFLSFVCIRKWHVSIFGWKKATVKLKNYPVDVHVYCVVTHFRVVNHMKLCVCVCLYHGMSIWLDVKCVSLCHTMHTQQHKATVMREITNVKDTNLN